MGRADMGTGSAQREHARVEPVWSGADVNAAAAVGAAQLPVTGLVLWAVASSGDTYGAGYGGGLAALGLACMLLFSPPVFAFLGLAQAVAHTMPAMSLGRMVARRVSGREWVWRLVFVVVIGAFWAGSAAALTGVAYPGMVLLLACSGALSTLGVLYVRKRARTPGRALGMWGVWFRSPLVTLCVGALAVPVTWGLYATGIVKEYEPPKLSAAQLTGVWRGDAGAVLRLRADGRAEATDLPAQPEFEYEGTREFIPCGGVGTWFLDRMGRYDTYGGEGPSVRDGVVVRLGGGCGADTSWTIGGTEDEPELYVLFGDPDAGELRILTRG
jgi:hypothetical protein